MKTRTKVAMSFIAIMLSVVLAFTFVMLNNNTKSGANQIYAETRTVELSQSSLDVQSVFDEFEDVELVTEGSLTTFTGYQKIDYNLLSELDLVGQANVDDNSNKRICYKSSYDTDNGIVTLKAVIEENSSIDESETIIDTLVGILIIDEDGNFDAVFDCDGEAILLSEMVDAGLVEECGFFSKLWSSVKKVWNTTAGKIGTIVTVAACVVVGVVCAVVPGGQLATAVCIGVAVGAVGGAVTAGVASLEDPSINWEDILICTGVGAVAGAISSAIGYGIGSLVKYVKTGHNLKYGDSFGKLGTYTKNPNISVDWSKTTLHASERMVERGMSKSLVETIVKTGKAFAQSGSKYFLITKAGVAVVDTAGVLITAYSSNYFDATILELLKALGL